MTQTRRAFLLSIPAAFAALRMKATAHGESRVSVNPSGAFDALADEAKSADESLQKLCDSIDELIRTVDAEGKAQLLGWSADQAHRMMPGMLYCEECDAWAFPQGGRIDENHVGVRFDDYDMRVYADETPVKRVIEAYAGRGGWVIRDTSSSGVCATRDASGRVVEFHRGGDDHCQQCAGRLFEVVTGNVTLERI